MSLGERVSLLLAAGGASWEVEALRAMAAAPTQVVLVKRCVDLPDLLATAATGQARVAVVAADLVGLDADSVALLGRAGLAVVLVGSSPGPAPTLPGVTCVVAAAEPAELVVTVVEAASSGSVPTSESAEVPTPSDPGPTGRASGRTIAVWGPTGAPGRTTVATGLAAELARGGADTLLVDADPYGGAVAQHLGVLDEVSGLLAAARLANAGRLDEARLAAAARQVAPGLRLLTGLPRPDRWVEVREPAFEVLLDLAQELCELVVLDLGFNLGPDVDRVSPGPPDRDHMTLAALDRADEVVVVGSADPVGLARLARGLVELLDVVPASGVRVVVNRARPGLGWREQEVRAMIEGFVVPVGVHFLPHDLAAVDRALVAGRPLTEVGDSALGAALARLADEVRGVPGPHRGGPGLRLLTRRRAGTAR